MARLVTNATLRRIALGAFVVILATATHWPKLRIVGPVPRTDLWLHLGAFGTLGVLVASAGMVGRVGSRKNSIASWGLAIAYAALDESTQAIPGLGRTAGLDDFAANATGVTLGVLAVAGIVALARVRGWDRWLLDRTAAGRGDAGINGAASPERPPIAGQSAGG
ncbi:MAG: VanZ family protein [Phycisphaeraceae bacterium]|nr:VanZ family protein [Phycisphaeraceae bacterium]